jgi:hypothetical protein
MMPPCRLLVSALLAAAILAAAVPASATTYVMVEDPVLADQASAVVDALVVSVEPAPVAGRPATDYTVEVERLVAGSAPGTTLIVRVPGGVRPDGMELQLHGMPRFTVGERALLFLVPRDDGTFGILHLGLGAFHRVAAAGSPPLALRDLSDAQEVVPPGSEASSDAGRARDYDAFAGWLADRAAGIERPADYFTETPPAALPRLAERFTLVNDGGLHRRWFEFDSGGSVPWEAHSAGQAGLPGGGFNEFKAALQAWNGESRTPVKLAFAGQTGASKGFDAFDDINTLLQGDPNNEISGSFRCGSGGTLAIGGTWAVGSQRGTFRGEEYIRVLGADIVMNDGVECNEIFNRCYGDFIAVIYTHELGHTLGLGHSCGDSRSPSCAGNPHLLEATMRASAQSDCRGAAIRSDDAAGLRRLYEPPGGGRPRGPAAPGSLEGDLRKAFVELRWVDNSEDEEGFRIYRSAGGGDFEPLATVGPDVTVFFDDSIAPATAYRYRVAAFNAKGESGQSQPVEVPVPPVTPVTVDLDLLLAPLEDIQVGKPVDLLARFAGPAEIAVWDFGGGAVGFNDTPCTSAAFCRSQIFTTPGRHTVEVTVVGDFGQVAHDTLALDVVDAPFETVAAESFFQSVIFGQRGNTGTFESNVWLHNAGERAALLDLSYLPRGLEAPPAPRTLTLAPAESVFLPNVLEKVFGVSAGQGSLALTARHGDQGDGPPRVFAASRSFVELANRAQGSFGQLVPQQDESSWTDADKVVTGILQGDGFLSTLLAVNVDDHGGRVDVELTDKNGDPVGDPVPLALGPGVMRFRPTIEIFPDVDDHEGPFTARFRSNGIRFLASSTLLETGSEDQLFLPAREPAGAAEILLPRVVRSPGQFGVFLTTRASVLNTSSVSTDLTFQLLLRGQNNSAPLEATRTVPPGGVLFLEDVIRDLFDLETATGALQVVWDNAQGVAPQVVALTLSESPQGDRFGMAIEGRPVDQAVTASSVGFGIEQSELFRSQYGVVNLRHGRTDLLLTLRDGNGAVLGQTDLALKPRQHLELNLVALFGETAGRGQNWSVTTEVASGGPVVPYIANISTSGDVFFVPGVPRTPPAVP